MRAGRMRLLRMVAQEPQGLFRVDLLQIDGKQFQSLRRSIARVLLWPVLVYLHLVFLFLVYTLCCCLSPRLEIQLSLIRSYLQA